MNRVPLTQAGADKLRAELERLKKVERPRIIQAIAEAREHGDLKENAEYHAAREEQGFTEGRIKELEGALSGAQIVDTAQFRGSEKIVFGAHVKLENEETGKAVEYQIVGDLEADIKQHLISVSSPISRALIGKETGDIVDVQAPGGVQSYEILAVSYD